MGYSRTEALYNGPCLDRRTLMNKVCANDYAGTEVPNSLNTGLDVRGKRVMVQYFKPTSLPELVGIISC